MLAKLKALFAKEPVPAPVKATAPFEVLMPEERPPPTEPKMAARVMSFLFTSPDDVTTIEFQGRSAYSSNKELKDFLTLVAGAKKIDNLVSECKSLMYEIGVEGSLGSMCCVSQGRLHKFTITELAPPPNLKWEVRRKLGAQQGAPGDVPRPAGSGRA